MPIVSQTEKLPAVLLFGQLVLDFRVFRFVNCGFVNFGLVSESL